MAGPRGGAAGCDKYAGQGRRVAVGTTVRPAATGGGGRRERKKNLHRTRPWLPRGSGGALPVHVSSLIGLLSSRRV